MKYLKYFRLTQFFIHLKNTKFRLTFIIRKSNKDGQPAILVRFASFGLFKYQKYGIQATSWVLSEILALTSATSTPKLALACKFAAQYFELNFPMLSTEPPLKVES